jgi:hypothetical protein
MLSNFCHISNKKLSREKREGGGGDSVTVGELSAETSK